MRDLFVKGLMDFAGEYRAEYCRYVRHSLDDDLSDISGQYLDSPSNHFWVAEDGDRVIGMVGVQRRSDEEAELRRMSVAAGARRQGVGLGLLETVQEFCRGMGYKRLKLTTDNQLDCRHSHVPEVWLSQGGRGPVRPPLGASLRQRHLTSWVSAMVSLSAG